MTKASLLPFRIKSTSLRNGHLNCHNISILYLTSDISHFVAKIWFHSGASWHLVAPVVRLSSLSLSQNDPLPCVAQAMTISAFGDAGSGATDFFRAVMIEIRSWLDLVSCGFMWFQT